MSIQHLPTEVIIDILTVLPLPSLLALTCTSKRFASICQDPVIWKQKLQNDFNFSSTSEAVHAAGFKRVYRGVRRPKVFVFGSVENGRLGFNAMASQRGQIIGGIPFPVQVTVNARVVSIAAGGWSFHALDDLGNLHVWGQLDGTSYGHSNHFSRPSKMALPAHRLELPGKMTSISCGRAHAASLDTSHRVWIFTSWGRPCLLSHPAVNSGGDAHRVVQVEAGWSFVSVLTKSGSVYAIWPFEGDFLLENRTRNGELDESQRNDSVYVNHKTISCIPIEMDVEPLLLPEIPDDLPTLRDENLSTLPRLIKIAAGDSFLIGLTDQGHVLSINLANPGGGPTPQCLQGAFVLKARQWTYLPDFSNINDIREDPADPNSKDDTTRGPHIQASKRACVTQISAHWNSFAALAPSSGLVLLGRKASHPSNEVLRLSGTVMATLQNRGVASVTLGDHHFGAVTSEGTFLTWGAFAEGALGLGDPRKLEVGAPGGYATLQELNAAINGAWMGRHGPPPVLTPAEVPFKEHNNSLRQPYCIAAAAGGCHTAALVIDLGGSDPSPVFHADAENGNRHAGPPGRNLFARAIASARSLMLGNRGGQS